MGNGVDMNVYISDLGGNQIKVVSENGYWFPRSWHPNGNKLIVGKYVSINESYIYIVDLDNGTMEQFNPKSEKISYGGASFSKDGEGIYYSSDQGTEFRHLRYYDIKKDKQGNPKPDTSKRDSERVLLSENVDEYYNREVKPHIPDSWMDRSKDKIGYEINFTKYFYKFTPLRSLEDISQELKSLDDEIKRLSMEMTSEQCS